jgi:hypothetical protein
MPPFNLIDLSAFRRRRTPRQSKSQEYLSPNDLLRVVSAAGTPANLQYRPHGLQPTNNLCWPTIVCTEGYGNYYRREPDVDVTLESDRGPVVVGSAHET